MKETILHTKNGRPVRQEGDRLFSNSGAYAGRIVDGKAYDPSGRYLATVAGDRLVYRSQDNTRTIGAQSAGSRGGRGLGLRGMVGIVGDEPNIPD